MAWECVADYRNQWAEGTVMLQCAPWATLALVDVVQIYSSPSGSPIHRPVSHPVLQAFSLLKRILDLSSTEQML